MGLRQRQWAAKWTVKLRTLLGGKCIDCGSTEDLEFDVRIPIGNDDHHNMEWSWRISFYRKQYDHNNLALRCTKCNSRKGNQMELLDTPETPF